MRRVLIIKVYPIILGRDLQHLIIGTVLEDELLNEVKGFLVLCVLTDLDDGAPCVRSELLFAVVALHVELGELGDEGLLHLCLVVDLFLDCDLDFDSFGVAFGPDETSVDDFGLVESFDFF